MKHEHRSPITPDFETWPVKHTPTDVVVENGALSITWSDGQTSLYHPFLLAENDPAPETLHPMSREATLTPLDLPEDLQVANAAIAPNGAIEVHWSPARSNSVFHPGWLRGIAWFGDQPAQSTAVLWAGVEQPEPPTFDGPIALEDPQTFLKWLVALRDYGVARLESLPNQDGLLMQIVERVGPIRESNFGRMYTLEIKDDPDSNAFTSGALMQHIDMPTRECPHGLQFLFCRGNSTSGGEGIYVDAYRVAEDLRREEPEHFQALCEINWTYNNRSKSSSYNAQGPVIEQDQHGTVTGIRYNTWLRAPLVASLTDQDRAYRSYRAFTARAQASEYQMEFAYRAGDLLTFDNRRALHGRNGYDAKGGTRFIEGIYSDRDDLHSAIRTLERSLAKDTAQ
ncbi:Gamma-butyrobetaine dioxygenase [Roseovarius albus]|uniref:Gamma-butyrobetaine dioxygenase n=1 Tax=Roseovarius albus TaxID=1247867 RepID=A0A1X6ZZP8_9RHOB|nr:TauD/TfdA family dioxygenase [Roseovarius albus]SLN66075.1 Gamma-butyrobetaine dioxygenase [Roseovarius albus]